MITNFKIFEYNNNDIDDILNQIDNFLNSTKRNLWIENDEIKIYIRKSKRFFKNRVLDFFDFASIEVENTGQGLFTKILKKFEEIYPDKNIFIESVLTERFADYIKNKLGFEKESDNVNNFYKIRTTIDYEIINDTYNDYINTPEFSKEIMLRHIKRTLLGFIKNRNSSIDDWIKKFKNEELVMKELNQIKLDLETKKYNI
jgi:hypothetical protein